MKLTVDSEEGTILRLKAQGEIAQGALNMDKEPVAALLGDSAYGKTVLLDLSEVDFIDSRGISWLLVCHKRCAAAGGRLIIHSLTRMVWDVIRVMRLNLVLSIAANEAAALAMARGEES